MKIAVAADHRGFRAKQRLVEALSAWGHQVEDFGTHSDESCDYPDFAAPAVHALADAKVDRAILVCANGIGMSMLANRVPGVRGALAYNERTARDTRAHHDSNALCLGADELEPDELLRMARAWLEAGFDAGRHARRISKVEAEGGKRER